MGADVGAQRVWVHRYRIKSPKSFGKRSGDEVCFQHLIYNKVKSILEHSDNVTAARV